jgi:DNA-binding response OmpR family regulator
VRQHILVVDDEPPIRELLTTFFDKHGYQITAVATAEEAQAVARTATVNLIILDIELADVDGLQLLGEFKERYPDLPVMILTAMGFDDQLLAEALQKGASAYVSKTLPLQQLLSEVQRTLHPQTNCA